MNFLRNGGLKNIAAIVSILLITAGVGSAAASTTAPLTLQIVGNGTVSPNYTNGQLLNVGQAYSLTAKSKSSFTFTGWTGDTNSSKAKLTFVMPSVGELLTANFADKQKPTLTIKTPANSTALTNPAIVIVGTARDNDAVATVFCNLNGTGWQAAATGNGWSNWWVNLTLLPNTNTLQAYAVDRSGNFSKTNLLKLTYSAAPTSLNGMLITVTNGDTLYGISFGSSTFSDGTGVGSYTYKKNGAVSGKLQLKYSAPPSAVGNDSATLTFSDATNGNFKAVDGTQGNFSLTTATNWAQPVTGAQVLLTDGVDTNNQTLLRFLTPPNITDNGHMFDVANPLVISLAAAYPGNISDRVSVAFTHLVFEAGTFVPVAPRTYTGTVIATDANATTNTATVLFDNSSFLSKSDLYAPTAGSPLNILTYYYTNSFGMTGNGTFIRTNFSPVGSLLQLNQDSTNLYTILTYTNQPSTNGSDAGTFYTETYGANGSFQGTNSGSFAIEQPPLIIAEPGNATVANDDTVNFYVTATGNQPLTYQWQFNGTNLTDIPSIISGSSTTNLTISTATTNDMGAYQVVVANFFGSVTSSPAMLTIGILPVITGPQDTSALTNTTAKFTLTSAGTPPLHFQWLNTTSGSNKILTDGSTSWGSIISGSSTTNLTINSVTNNDGGYYQCIVTNLYGSATSSAVKLTITNNTGSILAP